MLILSVGEGHPGIAVYGISDIVSHAKDFEPAPPSEAREKAEGPELPCLAQLEPYPDCCDCPKWFDDAVIEFSGGDVDFLSFDKEAGHWKETEDVDHAWHTWRWNIIDNKFTRMKK